MGCELHAVAVQALEYHNFGYLCNASCVKGKGHPDFAVRRFGGKGYFRRNLLAACHKRLARGFIHKDAFYGVLLAGDQVLVGYGILDGNAALGCDLFFALRSRLRPKLRDAVVDRGDFDKLFVFGYGHGIDLHAWQEALRRSKFPDKPFSARHIFKGEDAVFTGFCREDCRLCCKFGFLRAEQAEQRARDGFLVLTVDLQSLDIPVDESILNRLAAVDLDFHTGGVLSRIRKLHGIFFVRDDIPVVCCKLFDIQLCADWDVGLKYKAAVFAAVSGLQQPVRRDDAAVGCRQFLRGEQPEAHREDFAVHADSKPLILRQYLVKADFRLLALIVEGDFSGGHRNVFARVGQFNDFRLAADGHAVGCRHLIHRIFPKVQRLCDRRPVSAGFQAGDDLAVRIAQAAVRRDDIAHRADNIFRIRYPAVRVHRLIDPVRFRDGGEHLTGLADCDRTLLRKVVLFDHYGGLRAVYRKGDRLAVEDIAICRALLDNFIVSVGERLRQQELSCAVSVVDIDIHRRRIVDALHNIFAGIGISHLEADAGYGDHLAGFHILFHDLHKGFKHGVVDEIAVHFSVLADKHLKGREQLSALRAGDLFYGVSAVGKAFAFGIAERIADKDVPFGFLCRLIASRAFQVNLEYRAFLRRFDLRAAVVHMLQKRDFSFDDILAHVYRNHIMLDGKIPSLRADLINGFIQQVSFAGHDLPYRPVRTADIFRSRKRAVFICGILIHQLSVLVQTVDGFRKSGVALRRTGFPVCLGQGDGEFFEDVPELHHSNLAADNGNRPALLRHIAVNSLFGHGVFAGDKVVKQDFAVVFGNDIFLKSIPGYSKGDAGYRAVL